MKKPSIFIVVLFILLVLLGCALVGKLCSRSVSGGANFTHKLLPAGQGPHGHMAALDAAGSGKSTEEMGHVHDITAHIVDVANSHTHDLAPL